MASVQDTSISNNINQSFDVQPIADIKPTLNDSPTDFFVNRSNTANNVNVAESLLGDSLINSVFAKSDSGDSLSNSTKNIVTNSYYTIGAGANLTYGSSIGEIFDLTKNMLEGKQKTVAEAVKDEKEGTETKTDFKTKFLEFYDKNKAAVILGGVAAGWLIYRSVK